MTIEAFTSTDLPAGTQVYAYIIGEVQANGVNNQYHLDANRMPHLISTTDKTQAKNTFPDSNLLSSADATTIAANYPLDWADYSIPLSRTAPTVIDLANLNAIILPGLGTGTAGFSGRIYISVGIPDCPLRYSAARNIPCRYPPPIPGSSPCLTGSSSPSIAWATSTATPPK